MKVELLYFDGCPSWQDALANLRAVLGDGRDIRLMKVETTEQAEAERFAGSPTIRVDGRDIFPVGDEQYALACRVYDTPQGASGSPTVEMIRAALP
jgi:hypothetical protein